MKKIFAAMVAGALLLPALGSAEPAAFKPGFYAGVGVGGARVKAKLSDIGVQPQVQSDIDAINSEFDGDDLASQYFGGYRFNPYLGVEVGYVNFGDIRQYTALPDACNNRGCQSRQWTVKDQTDGFQLFVTGTYPIVEMVDVIGKIGVLNWDAKYQGNEQVRDIVPSPPAGLPGPQNATVKNNDNGTGLAVSIGADIKTEGHFSLRPELAWYDISDTDGIWFLGLNAIYTF